MSGSTACVDDIPNDRIGGSGDRVALIPKKRKKGSESESLLSKVPKTTQVSEKMHNHGNGMASSHDAAFSIDKILAPSFKDAELPSSKPAGGAGAEISKNSCGSLSSPGDEKKTKDSSEGKEMAEVESGINNMPAEKWYNTLLWQQHQQQYQQQLAASAFYHTQHFQHCIPNGASPPQRHPHFGPGPLSVPPSGVPLAFCPMMPGRVHPFNCQCAELMSEQPYFLLTPAGYSIPSPFQPDHHYSSLRYCRRRKARTVFTEYQIRGLEARFVHQQYLSTHERVELANVLFLTEGQVKTWFQNRRMKQKKLARDSQHPGDDQDDSDELDFDEEAEGDSDVDDDFRAETPQTNDTVNK